MSGVVRFISDLHFEHINIAKARGFNSPDEMELLIVKEWNSIVDKGDVTYILGDITMEKKSGYRWLSKLNGIKKVVLGNHDMPQHVEELKMFVNKVSGMIDYDSKEFGNIVLTHCPIHPLELRGRVNIHGHVHTNSIPDERYINVCPENIGYSPKTLEELFNKYKYNYEFKR